MWHQAGSATLPAELTALNMEKGGREQSAVVSRQTTETTEIRTVVGVTHFSLLNFHSGRDIEMGIGTSERTTY